MIQALRLVDNGFFIWFPVIRMAMVFSSHLLWMDGNGTEVVTGQMMAGLYALIECSQSGWPQDTGIRFLFSCAADSMWMESGDNSRLVGWKVYAWHTNGSNFPLPLKTGDAIWALRDN